MRAFFVAALLLSVGCTVTPVADAGTGGGAGGGGGVDGPRPGRTIVSSDQRAFLWVPDGGAPGDVVISVEPMDGGYRMSPSGLVFDPPALLFVPVPSDDDPDAGVGFINASLHSDDGSVESARTVRTAARGHDGFNLGMGVVEIRHFTDVIIEVTVPGGAARASGVELWMEPKRSQRSFDQEKGDRWFGRVVLSRANAPFFVGSYFVAASGSVELTTGGEDVGTPRPVNLVADPLASADFEAKCVGTGPGTLTLTIFSTDFSHSLALAHTGICREKAATVSLDPTRKETATSPTTGLQALADATVKAVSQLRPTLAVEDVRAAVTPAVAAVNPTAMQRPGYDVAWNLPCTDHCALGVEYFGHVLVTNRDVNAFIRGSLTAKQSPITLSAVLGDPTFTPEPGVSSINLSGKKKVDAGATVDLVFTYSCSADGLDFIRTNLDLLWDVGLGIAGYSFQNLSPLVTCGIGGDAIMLSDNSRVSVSGASFVAAAPGVAANLIHAHSSVSSKFFPTSAGTNFYTGVSSFQSNQGLSPLTLRSGRQTATATFNGTRYAFTGLTGGAAFNATDALTVQATPSGMPPVSLVVNAPPPLANINAFIGAKEGLRTQIHLPDGSFDTFFVSVVGGPPGAPAGQSGVLHTLTAAQMTLAGTERVAPLLDDETIAMLTDLGWTVQTLYVAYFRQQDTALFFPGQRPLPVQAGRMFQITASDLNP